MSNSVPHTAISLAPNEHSVTLEKLSPNAIKVCERLHSSGFQAYLVGGCVRDILLGQQPKDFDIATNARPEQIKGLFRNCRLIGRRFRLAHIVFGREIIEVATFRGPHVSKNASSQANDVAKADAQGQLVRDNVYGTIEEDAVRRDFTVNALYFGVHNNHVLDFVGGLEDLNKRRLCLIGDPETRYREDPVRMLRAVRFAAKLNMQIDAASSEAIHHYAGLLQNIPPARLFEEVLKLLFNGKGLATYELLEEFELFAQLFPQTAQLTKAVGSREARFVEQVVINTDNRINNGQRVTPAFIYAALLWYPIEEATAKYQVESGLSPADAFSMACSHVLGTQLKRIMIPKRFSIPMREIWHFQHRLSKRYGRRAYQMLAHPRFRAAYDFLLLRGQIEGGELFELAQWWTDFQEANNEQRKVMLDALRQSSPSKGRYRRKRKKS
jgi:poly(A) polymerase